MSTLFDFFKKTLYKHSLALFVVGGLFGQNLALMAEEAPVNLHRGIPYATLATFFPTPIELPAEKGSTATSTTPQRSADETLNEKLNNDFSSLSIHEKRNMAFDLLSASEAPQEIDTSAISLLHELEIFNNRNNPEAPSIFSTINKVNTVFGEVSLAYMLANQTDDITVLAKRQAIIRELVENEALFNSLDAALTRVKKAEGGFLAFAYATIQEEKKEAAEEKARKETGPSLFSYVIDPLYNGLAYLAKPLAPLAKAVRTSPVVLEGVKLTNDCLLPATLIYSLYLGQTINARLRNTQSLLDNAPGAVSATVATNEALFPWRELNPFNYKALYHEMVQKLIAQNMTPEQARTEAVKNISLLGVTSLYAAGKSCYAAYTFIKTIKDASTENYTLHKKMNHTATVINACKTLNTAIEQERTLKEGFASQEILTDFFNAQNNHDLSRLLGYLQTNTFKGEPSYFSYYGRVFASETLSKDHIKTLISVMKAIGEIDAYMSIAKLYKESQQDNVRYCFARYQSSSTPSLSLQGFWHPLIAKEKVVSNDLVMGGSSCNSGIILTGSNTGGKSTILKSTLLSILLAQTFTIAPAQAVTLTPFTLLGSYLSVSDDIASGNSLFKAEVLRAKSLLQNVSDLQPGQVAFVVIDELFTGTAADKGSAAACKVADALASKNNVTYILATHFPELTLLENATNGRCKNYQIDVIRNSDGTITRPFKIQPGISTTSIANDLLQEELVDLVF